MTATACRSTGPPVIDPEHDVELGHTIGQPRMPRSYRSFASGVSVRRVAGSAGSVPGPVAGFGRVEGGDVLAPQGHRMRLGTIVLAASLQLGFTIPNFLILELALASW